MRQAQSYCDNSTSVTHNHMFLASPSQSNNTSPKRLCEKHQEGHHRALADGASTFCLTDRRFTSRIPSGFSRWRLNFMLTDLNCASSKEPTGQKLRLHRLK